MQNAPVLKGRERKQDTPAVPPFLALPLARPGTVLGCSLQTIPAPW